MNFVAPCLFGLEGIVADELRRMDAENVVAENGRVLFSGKDNILARANINLRTAERVLILVGKFKAKNFTELFENVKNLPFENFIGKNDAFPVKGWSLQSALHSIPDCQKIIKKAIVERLKLKYSIGWFEETGKKYQIQFSILKDEVSIMIDTSGEGLHKRGYRANANEAPIKETLAAAFCSLARIYPDTRLFDPFCGSGTILIEAALIANNIAPGLKRGFVSEGFDFLDQSAFRVERERALDLISRTSDFHAFGSDIDGLSLEIAEKNAEKAGVSSNISFSKADIKDFSLDENRALIITNPPYGERLLDIRQAEQLYKIMGEKFIKERGKKYYIITPDEQFEKIFGREADKRRKLYNGNIKCQLYMYFKAWFIAKTKINYEQIIKLCPFLTFFENSLILLLIFSKKVLK